MEVPCLVTTSFLVNANNQFGVNPIKRNATNTQTPANRPDKLMAKSRYFGATATNANYIPREIKAD
jgi:hypothetical protein